MPIYLFGFNVFVSTVYFLLGETGKGTTMRQTVAKFAFHLLTLMCFLKIIYFKFHLLAFFLAFEDYPCEIPAPGSSVVFEDSPIS